jgi:hypothetical protein
VCAIELDEVGPGGSCGDEEKREQGQEPWRQGPQRTGAH